MPTNHFSYPVTCQHPGCTKDGEGISAIGSGCPGHYFCEEHGGLSAADRSVNSCVDCRRIFDATGATP